MHYGFSGGRSAAAADCPDDERFDMGALGNASLSKRDRWGIRRLRVSETASDAGIMPLVPGMTFSGWFEACLDGQARSGSTKLNAAGFCTKSYRRRHRN